MAAAPGAPGGDRAEAESPFGRVNTDSLAGPPPDEDSLAATRIPSLAATTSSVKAAEMPLDVTVHSPPHKAAAPAADDAESGSDAGGDFQVGTHSVRPEASMMSSVPSDAGDVFQVGTTSLGPAAGRSASMRPPSPADLPLAPGGHGGGGGGGGPLDVTVQSPVHEAAAAAGRDEDDAESDSDAGDAFQVGTLSVRPEASKAAALAEDDAESGSEEGDAFHEGARSVKPEASIDTNADDAFLVGTLSVRPEASKSMSVRPLARADLPSALGGFGSSGSATPLEASRELSAAPAYSDSGCDSDADDTFQVGTLSVKPEMSKMKSVRPLVQADMPSVLVGHSSSSSSAKPAEANRQMSNPWTVGATDAGLAEGGLQGRRERPEEHLERAMFSLVCDVFDMMTGLLPELVILAILASYTAGWFPKAEAVITTKPWVVKVAPDEEHDAGPGAPIGDSASPPGTCRGGSGDSRCPAGHEVQTESIAFKARKLSEVMQACVRFRQVDRALGLFDQMLEEGVGPEAHCVNKVTINKFCNLVANNLSVTRLRKDGLALCDLVQAHGVAPSWAIQNRLIIAWKSRPPRSVLTYLLKMRSEGFALSRLAYFSIIICSEISHPEIALTLCDEMETIGITPDKVTYNAVLGACYQLEMYDEAGHLFAQMEDRGLTPDMKTFRIMINVSLRSQCFEDTVALLETMQDKCIKLAGHDYHKAIEYCISLQRVDDAVALFNNMAQTNFLGNLGHHAVQRRRGQREIQVSWGKLIQARMSSSSVAVASERVDRR
ncbi:unnamed protein product [Prorocentrum cordatum]|uniref:Pentacotripeptide-repeat region of PRORP domain-containing protein n=1 Tax=Prorocentrum cordatum TaxID=2364126 RepID=A0ABN9UBK4_9DINO|nr:unnamed protein product [Polarella glacialis]